MTTITSTRSTMQTMQTPVDDAEFGEAQLAAASFLARYRGRTLGDHALEGVGRAVGRFHEAHHAVGPGLELDVQEHVRARFDMAGVAVRLGDQPGLLRVTLELDRLLQRVAFGDLRERQLMLLTARVHEVERDGAGCERDRPQLELVLGCGGLHDGVIRGGFL